MRIRKLEIYLCGIGLEVSDASGLGVGRRGLQGLGGADNDVDTGKFVIELDAEEAVEWVGDGHLRL